MRFFGFVDFVLMNDDFGGLSDHGWWGRPGGGTVETVYNSEDLVL